MKDINVDCIKEYRVKIEGVKDFTLTEEEAQQLISQLEQDL